MTIADVWSALCRRRLLVILTILFMELGAHTRVHSMMFIFRGAPSYVSTGKILLRPTSARVKAFGEHIEVNPTQSSTNQLWFMDFRYIREMLLDEKFLRRVLDDVPDHPASLTVAVLQSEIVASPMSLRREQLDVFYLAEAQEGRVNADQELEDQSVKSMEKEDRNRGMLQLISISVRSSTPELAEKLAKALVNDFLGEARQRAAREYTEQREALEKHYQTAQANQQRIEAILLTRTGTASPNVRSKAEIEVLVEIDKLESSKLSKQGVIDELRRDSSEIAKSMAEESNGLKPAATDGPVGVKISAELVGARAQYSSDLAVYRPDNPFLEDEKKNLERLQGLQTSVNKDSRKSSLQDKSARIATVEAEIHKIDLRLKELHATQATSAEQQELNRLERAEQQWENTMLTLVPQVYRSRVLERQAEARGSLILIDQPQSGFLSSTTLRQTPSYVPMLATLPLGTFASILLALLVDALHRRAGIPHRLARRIDAPIWGSVPTFEKRRESAKS